MLTNCATLGLEAYVPSEEMPWNVARVQHLFRRAGFGATPAQIELALTLSPAEAVNRMLDVASTRPARPEPEWAYWDYEAIIASGREVFPTFMELNMGFLEDAVNYGVREKLALFWQNHLVTIYENHGCPGYHYQWMKLIDRMAFGDYKEFVKRMTTEPAMLFFLNGFENTRDNPNENYARELFELFTLGENNGYTQQDIVEASRALTGFNGWTSYCGGVEFADWGFDGGEKTVFGVTANLNHESLIDVLFDRRPTEISKFICGKLYAYYVNKAPNEEVISAMAATFRASGFQVMPVLRELFSSAHFFEASNVGALIKSPVELMVSFLRQGGFPIFGDSINWGHWAAANMGQYLGHAPDVAGWMGDRAWIDSNRLTLRWDFIHNYAWGVFSNGQDDYRDLAKALTGNSNSPEVIATAIVDYYVPRGLLTDTAYEVATDVLKWDVPANYYTTGQWNLDYDGVPFQVMLLIQHIARIPQFQLN